MADLRDDSYNLGSRRELNGEELIWPDVIRSSSGEFAPFAFLFVWNHRLLTISQYDHELRGTPAPDVCFCQRPMTTLSPENL